MYKLFFLFLSLFSITAANAFDAEECYFQGKGFSGSHSIDQNCYPSQFFSGNELFERKVRGKKISYEGNKNIMWVTRLSDHIPRPIAGEKSQLNDILAISLSSDEKLLAVLDKDSNEKKIHIFGSHLSGHIKPYYTFAFSNLEKAVALSFNQTGTKIYFVTKENERHQLHSFELYKDKKYGPHFLEKLIDPVDLTQSGDYLFVLDRMKKIHLYRVDDTNEHKWVSTIEIEDESLGTPHSIRFSSIDQTLYVSDKQGQTIQYLVD